jgi:hypothetical protein
MPILDSSIDTTSSGRRSGCISSIPGNERNVVVVVVVVVIVVVFVIGVIETRQQLVYITW